MLTEAELQKQWERLTFTDDFIFSRVMHDENICRQGRFLENSTTWVLRGGQPLSSAGVLAASTQCAASSEGEVLGGARGKTSQPLGRF